MRRGEHSLISGDTADVHSRGMNEGSQACSHRSLTKAKPKTMQVEM